MNKRNRKFRFKPYASFTLFLLIFGTLISITFFTTILFSIFHTNLFNIESPFPYIVFGLVISQTIATIIYSYYNRKIAKNINILLDGLEKLSRGEFSVRIDENKDNQFKELIQQFNNTAKELSSIETLKEDFASNFSHEFKTPIVSIKGFAKLLKNNNISNEEKEDYINTIIEETERLEKLANNSLILTKIESQVIVSEKNNFRLDEQIRKVLLLLENKWCKKNIVIEINLDEIDYYGNETMLKEVWINLIDNAIKFTPNNGIIKIRSEINDATISVHISDNGIGMDQKTKNHIFDKYYQGDRSRSTDGNGLGLSIVKNILTLHNSEIDVISHPNKGTTFIIELLKEKKYHG